MKNWFKENWFRVLVIILLILIYGRLGEIKEYTFNNWDAVDAGFNKTTDAVYEVRSSIEDLRIDLNYR